MVLVIPALLSEFKRRLSLLACIMAESCASCKDSATDYRLRLIAPGEVETYVPAKRLAGLSKKYCLEPGPKPNVTVHAVDDPWPLSPSCRVVPPVVVALDLLEADDESSQHAGWELLGRLDAEG